MESDTGLIPRLVIQPPTLERDSTSPDYIDSTSAISTVSNQQPSHAHSNENIEGSINHTSLVDDVQAIPSLLVPGCHLIQPLPCLHSADQGACRGVCPSSGLSPDTGTSRTISSSSPQPQTDAGMSSIGTSPLSDGTPGCHGNGSDGNMSTTDTSLHYNDHPQPSNDYVPVVNQKEIDDTAEVGRCRLVQETNLTSGPGRHEVTENGKEVSDNPGVCCNAPHKSRIPLRVGSHGRTKVGRGDKNQVPYNKDCTSHDELSLDDSLSLHNQTLRLDNSWTDTPLPPPRRRVDRERNHCKVDYQNGDYNNMLQDGDSINSTEPSASKQGIAFAFSIHY